MGKGKPRTARNQWQSIFSRGRRLFLTSLVLKRGEAADEDSENQPVPFSYLAGGDYPGKGRSVGSGPFRFREPEKAKTA